MAPLMCVYGSGFNNILEFLEEGLYDFTVFDSLYKDDRNPWPEPNKDLLHFLSSARRQQNSLLDFFTERFRFASNLTECLFSTRAE
ncbi:hypothetical protein MRX96_042721 [Rhipicephalus microplus]